MLLTESLITGKMFGCKPMNLQFFVIGDSNLSIPAVALWQSADTHKRCDDNTRHIHVLAILSQPLNTLTVHTLR